VFLSCVFRNFIFVLITSGQDCNSGMQKRKHFWTDMEHNICRPVNNSDVSLGYQFCKDITFILYIIYNVRYNKRVCWIDLVFVTELTVVRFFFQTAFLSIKTAFNLVKIHWLFRIMLSIQLKRKYFYFYRPCCYWQ
jgi:hypothetical protein